MPKKIRQNLQAILNDKGLRDLLARAGAECLTVQIRIVDGSFRVEGFPNNEPENTSI
jgi:hypothetical protein